MRSLIGLLLLFYFNLGHASDCASENCIETGIRKQINDKLEESKVISKEQEDGGTSTFVTVLISNKGLTTVGATCRKDEVAYSNWFKKKQNAKKIGTNVFRSSQARNLAGAPISSWDFDEYIYRTLEECERDLDRLKSKQRF